MNWVDIIEQETQKDYFQHIIKTVKHDRSVGEVYPPPEQLFTAFDLCPFEQTRVVILGQDPYHTPNTAHGLAFSVEPNCKIPPSLQNIYKELKNDLGIDPPTHGCLKSWAEQGVLLLNSALTVRRGDPGSHIQMWEPFTKQIIKILNAKEQPVVFLLWGNFAKKKQYLITNEKHLTLSSSHPSPLGCHNGFFGCNHFSKTNEFLILNKLYQIDWRIKCL